MWGRMSTQTTPQLDKFTLAYIGAALWSSVDDEGNPLDSRFSPEDLPASALLGIAADCIAFRAEAGELLDGLSDEQAGHDFWLTRNRHGAGFWDRGLGAVGDKLTEIAQSFGESDFYIGDDGQLYLS